MGTSPSAAVPRLIASDIDGTLIDDSDRVSALNRAAIGRAVKAGALFVLATGRPFRWLRPVIEQLPVRPLCVTSNGSVLYDSDNDEVVGSNVLSPDALQEVAFYADKAVADRGGVCFAVERVGRSAGDPLEELFVVDPQYSQGSPFAGFGVRERAEVLAAPASKLLLRNDSMSSREMYERIAMAIDPAVAHVTYSVDAGLLEVGAPGVTKASALKSIAAERGIESARVVAFGDMPNDIEMLQWAGYGYAMGNAEAAVRHAARYLAPTNGESGVGAVLSTWF